MANQKFDSTQWVVEHNPSAEAVARVLPLRIRLGRYGLQPQISTTIVDTCLQVLLWDTVKCPIMARTKSSHSGHFETSGAGHLGHYETFLYGHRWDHSGHYETFSWDITRLNLPKFFFGRFTPPPPPFELRLGL